MAAPDIATPKNYMTIREAAKVLPITEYYMRKLCKAGELPGYVWGNRFMVDCEGVMELLKNAGRRV